jgi:phosphoribosylformylglycinamidine synthase
MTQTYRIEVFWRGGADGRAADLLGQIAHLGLNAVKQVTISNLYFLRGALTTDEVQRIAVEFLVDPIVEGYRWRPLSVPPVGREAGGEIEVGFHPGVTDPVAKHLLHRARQLGVSALEAVVTGARYAFAGNVPPADLRRIAEELLCNPVIQSYTLGELQPEFVPDAAPSDAVDIIPLRDLDADALQRLSAERVLFLSPAEMQAIQAEFQTLGRDPTDVELEILAQTWSEHCQHKTFKAEIDYTCHGGMPRIILDADSRRFTQIKEEKSAFIGGNLRTEKEMIPSLIKTYLRAVTERLAKPWVRSAFVDNAGIVDFDDEYEVSFKVETHNHPSALEPFGGANTGVGGVIRDVMGVSAQPIANTDVLCFGPLDMADADVPGGTLHPRRIARGVVAGIKDYGNKMGIPTVNGAILYHPDYVANPLVYCGCVGIAPKGRHRTTAHPGDLCVALGGRTGRDGLHGANVLLRRTDAPTPGRLSAASSRSATPSPRRPCLTRCSWRGTRASTPPSPTAARAASHPPSARWARTWAWMWTCATSPSSTPACARGKSGSARRRSAWSSPRRNPPCRACATSARPTTSK